MHEQAFEMLEKCSVGRLRVEVGLEMLSCNMNVTWRLYLSSTAEDQYG